MSRDVGAFPGVSPGWQYRFDTVLALTLRRVTDGESWLPRYDGEIILGDSGGDQLRITLTGVTGELSLTVGQTIAGLRLLDTREDGYEAEARYHLRDYECGELDLFCRDILVEPLEGPERCWEDCP